METVSRDLISNLPQRIINKIDFTEFCWVWTGAKLKGYGQVHWNGATAYAHLVVYKLVIGEYDTNLEADHVVCQNPPCVNPFHLEFVTHAENVRRGNWSKGAAKKRLAQTHCKRGHEYTTENTRINKTTKARSCKKCHALLEIDRRANRL